MLAGLGPAGPPLAVPSPARDAARPVRARGPARAPSTGSTRRALPFRRAARPAIPRSRRCSGSSSTAFFSQTRASASWPSRCKHQAEVGVGQGQVRDSAAGPPDRRPGRRRTGPAPAGRCRGYGAGPPNSGSSRTASWQCGSASSAWPRSSSIWPRFVCAGAKAGSSSTARRKCSSASSAWPSSRRADAQVVVSHCKSGRSSSARRSARPTRHAAPAPATPHPGCRALRGSRARCQGGAATVGRPLEIAQRAIGLGQVRMENATSGRKARARPISSARAYWSPC